MCVYLLPCHFKHNRNNAWKGKNTKIKKCANKFQFSCTNMYGTCITVWTAQKMGPAAENCEYFAQ